MLAWLVIDCRTALQAGARGLAFSFSMHLVGHGWILNGLHAYAGAGLFSAAFATFIFLSYLSLFTAVPCLLSHGVMKSSVPLEGDKRSANWGGNPSSVVLAIVAFSSLLTLGEWMRSLFFNGFTSLSLGYSLIDTWLAGYAPVGGLYAVSWIGYCLASFAVWCMCCRPLRLAFAALIIALVAFGGAGLRSVKWGQASGAPLSYRLIQLNVAQQWKFDPLHARHDMQRLLDIIETQPADLVITPETAFTASLSNLPAEALPRLQQFSTRTGSHVFLGVLTSAVNGDGYNSVVLFAPGQVGIAEYDKVSLMPFGEYSPVGFHWLSGGLAIPFKDLSAGKLDQPPFVVRDQRVGTLICHEEQVGQDLRRWLPEATVLINPSNLAWFEGSAAIGQSLQIARMRALETSRPLLRVTNTGITAHINAQGRVVDRLPEAQDAALTGTVQPMSGATPYVRLGNLPVLLCCWMPVLLLLFRAWAKHVRKL